MIVRRKSFRKALTHIGPVLTRMRPPFISVDVKLGNTTRWDPEMRILGRKPPLCWGHMARLVWGADVGLVGWKRRHASQRSTRILQGHLLRA